MILDPFKEENVLDALTRLNTAETLYKNTLLQFERMNAKRPGTVGQHEIQSVQNSLADCQKEYQWLTRAISKSNQ